MIVILKLIRELYSTRIRTDFNFFVISSQFYLLLVILFFLWFRVICLILVLIKNCSCCHFQVLVLLL